MKTKKTLEGTHIDMVLHQEAESYSYGILFIKQFYTEFLDKYRRMKPLTSVAEKMTEQEAMSFIMNYKDVNNTLNSALRAHNNLFHLVAEFDCAENAEFLQPYKELCRDKDMLKTLNKAVEKAIGFEIIEQDIERRFNLK